MKSKNEMDKDTFFMKMAYQQAKEAYEQGEVPVGAIIVAADRILAKANNQTQKLQDVTAHAEMIAITAAANALQSKYLSDCTIYVTLEPCMMCAAALRWAQMGRLVYAAPDDKAGYSTYGVDVLHPRTKVAYGLLQDECGQLLRQFFQERRNMTGG